jgi:hypothetical protein
MTLSKTERSYQGRRETRHGTYDVCSSCPLLGDEGHVLGETKPCGDEGVLICNRILGESTTPKILRRGRVRQPDGEVTRWWKKNRKPKG